MKHLLEIYCALTSFKLIKNERGVTALEYALIGSAIALVIFGAFTIFAGGLRQALFSICGTLGVTCATPAE